MIACRSNFTTLHHARFTLPAYVRSLVFGLKPLKKASTEMAASSKPSQGQLVEKCMKQSMGMLVDIGANLADDSFDKDRDEVLQRAAATGVRAIIITGCSIKSSEAAKKLCERYKGQYNLFFTAGVHPHSAKGCDDTTLDKLRRLASHECCVAIGECGLDFNRNFSPPDVQETWFNAQVSLACELKKPLFLHCRDAADRFFAILRQHDLQAPAVMHCFTGSKEELQGALELGLYIGITGWICDDRPERGGAELASLLPTIPTDRLMIETDAPYLTPRTIKPSKARPSRNEPALLPHVLETAAESLSQPVEEVAAATTGVARRVFSLPDAIFQ